MFWASQSRVALPATASRTGCKSVGERLMTFRISLVAVCCSSASVSSRLRSCNSENSLAFSIAITAWSANVWTRAIWRSVKGSTSRLGRLIAPIGRPGAGATAPPAQYAPPTRGGSGAGRSSSGTAGEVGDVHHRAGRDRPAGRSRETCHRLGRLTVQGDATAVAGNPARRGGRPRPRRGRSAARSVPHSRAALGAMVSSTCCRSVGARLIAASTPAVAVCCSSASSSCRFAVSVVLLQFGEETGVLDRDHGLVREGLQQRGSAGR